MLFYELGTRNGSHRVALPKGVNGVIECLCRTRWRRDLEPQLLIVIGRPPTSPARPAGFRRWPAARCGGCGRPCGSFLQGNRFLGLLGFGICAAASRRLPSISTGAVRVPCEFQQLRQHVAAVASGWRKGDILLYVCGVFAMAIQWPHGENGKSIGRRRLLHVITRGNGRAEVFHKPEDYAAFMKLMHDATNA